MTYKHKYKAPPGLPLLRIRMAFVPWTCSVAFLSLDLYILLSD